MSCEKMIAEHDEDGKPCDNDEHRAVLAVRRLASAAPWSVLERRVDAGGFRDYLDGQPIHCGDGLELQGQEYANDDYGDFIRRLPKGAAVRYEIDWHPQGKRPVIYLEVFGYAFMKVVEPWMRFRWPPRR